MACGANWTCFYNELEDERPLRPFYIKALKPIQVAAFDLESYLAGRAQFSRVTSG